MATAARPQATVSPVESKSTALALYNKKELATFTSDHARALLVPMLPKGVVYETVLSELYFAIKKNPEIGNCTPDSQLMAVQRCLSWGLTIGDKAHLVPFWSKNGTILTPVRDYKGDIELIYRATGVHIDAGVVWSDEEKNFDYGLGDSPFVKHRPALKRADGAKIIAAYAIAHMGRGAPPKIVVVGIDEIEKIRKDKSKGWYEEYIPGGPKGAKRVIPIERIPWYCEKTVVHKIAKQLPTTPTNQVALQAVATQLEDEIITDAVIEDAADAPSAGQVATPERDGRTPGSEPAGADADGAVASADDGQVGPKCSVHGAAMVNQATTKTNVKAPDYYCPIEGCKEVLWPGQWPPKPLATDEQRAELGRLSKVAERAGLPKVTITAVNKKVADPALKAHRADEHIRLLTEKIAEKEKENARDAKAKEVATTGTADSSPATKELF